MKEIWLKAEGDTWEEVKEQMKDAIEIGFTGAIVPEEFVEKAKKLGRIEILGSNEAIFIDIKSKEDQEKALRLSSSVDRIFLQFSDWKIIPLENLIAMKKGAKLIAEVESLEDANVVLTTLEKGADGIVVRGKRSELLKYFNLVSQEGGRIALKIAKIAEIRPLGVGERVCIDTVTLMEVGEGMLVGNRAGFLFLVASESEESEYVESRPFRVNAGSVNAYLKVGSRTKYLSELKSGDEVDIVRHDGKVRKSFVGRVKIERRPLLLVRAVSGKEEGSIILQNAETIKLVSPGGKHKSVAELNEGDEVLVWVGEKARHFGVGVEEFVVER